MKKIGSFFALLLLNMLMNILWTIPSWILLILHFILGWSIIWFWITLGIWFVGNIIWMYIIKWAAKCSKPTEPRENKNPYSVGQTKKTVSE